MVKYNLMKIAIVEDNQNDINRLKECIEQYSSERKTVFNIVAFKDPIAFVNGFCCDFDIIFFDIEMPGMNGIETARKIRERDDSVVIVFVTNLGQYAIEGYSVNAVDFILKPVNIFSFKLKFERILFRVETSSEESFLIRAEGKMLKILIKDLDYIEVFGHYLNYCVNGEQIQEYNTLKSVEEKLSQYNFVKCHRSFLVNLSKVQSIDKDQVKINGKHLQIARPQRKAFLQALSDYMGGR